MVQISNFLKLFHFLLVFFLLGALPNHAGATLRCELLFSQSPINKYEILAAELGLTYLKSSSAEGYKRTILNSRTYFKKDGTPGKTLRYYRYFRPDGSLIRPRLDAQEYEEIVARMDALQIDPQWDGVWLSNDETTHFQVKARNGKFQDSCRVCSTD